MGDSKTGPVRGNAVRIPRVQFTIRSLMIAVMVVAVLLEMVYPWRALSPFLIFVCEPMAAAGVVIVIFVLMTELFAWWLSR